MPYIALYSTEGAPTITHVARFNKAFLAYYWELSQHIREEELSSRMEETQEKVKRLVQERLVEK